MIGSLRGEVLERGLDGTVLVEVGGVGYVILVSPRTLPELEPTSTLITTHGVGPALAMAMLASHPPAALVDIVAAGDVGALTLVPGVGRKTAERLLVELKSRLSVTVLDPVGGPSGGSAVGDVREALSGLGYGSEEIREALRELPGDLDAPTLLRDALKLLGARRA